MRKTHLVKQPVNKDTGSSIIGCNGFEVIGLPESKFSCVPHSSKYLLYVTVASVAPKKLICI